VNQHDRNRILEIMTIIAVVYYSGSGHTAKMAEAVAKGARAEANTQVLVLPIRGEDIVNGRFTNAALLAQLDGSHAIIFGTPTYMGGPAAQFKAFADATAERWFGRQWANKIGAGFTVSGGPSGDKLSTLQYLATLALQQGMIWVGLEPTAYNDQGINRLSSHYGVMGQAGRESPEVAPNEPDKLTGEIFGRRVAEAAKRWQQGAN
jgi:NAD(P)H dehydrogenase (quinone)